jgi:hypothetical protein
MNEPQARKRGKAAARGNRQARITARVPIPAGSRKGPANRTRPPETISIPARERMTAEAIQMERVIIRLRRRSVIFLLNADKRIPKQSPIRMALRYKRSRARGKFSNSIKFRIL